MHRRAPAPARQRLTLVALAWAALLAAWPGMAQADGARVALLIGNGAYRSLPPLANPVTDATLLTTALERRGFKVELARDGDLGAMRAALDRFGTAAAGAEIALIYYSGHGVQVDGTNYLLPVGADIRSRDDLAVQTLTLPVVLAAVQAAAPRLGVVVLDACRDNPLPKLAAPTVATRSLAPSEGLARMPVQQGMLIAYATAPGQVALDGPPGQNSPFAAALARYLDEPGLEIGLLFRKVGERVREITAGAQVPWTEAALTGDPVYLHQAAAGAAADDEVTALNAALALDEPEARRLALGRYVAAQPPGSRLAATAAAYLDRLGEAEKADDSLAAEVLDWQRVEAVAGTVAEPLALTAFRARYPGGALAAKAAARETILPDRPTAAPADGATRLWPLVEVTADPDGLARFAALFPGTVEATAAHARLELAQLSLPPATAFRPDTGPLVLASVVGTGPTPLDLPGLPAAAALVQAPRHGRILSRGGKGGEVTLGAEPKLVAGLAYEPDPQARDLVDELVIRLGEGPTGAPRELRLRVHVDVDACDEAAGARFDLQGVVLGRYPNEIDPEAAVVACRSAVERFPAVARFRYELGRALEAKGEHVEAGEAYGQAAAGGHWLGLTALGSLHETGRGVPQDARQAVALYEQAAAKGEPLAMNSLGRAWRDGRGVPQRDRERAIDWFLQAAARGHSFAYNNLGTMLAAEGRDAEALALFRASAEGGDIYGFNNLGWAYENGIGVAPDLEKAISWYEKAAAGGQPMAPINLGLIHRDGRPGVPSDLGKAAFWFAEAARRGAGWGNVHLAALYADGRLPGGADPVLAAELLARAAGDGGAAGEAARQELERLPRSALVAAAQHGLAGIGLDPGPVDGRMGERTRAAIRSFAEGREPPFPELLAALATAGRER